MMSEFLVRLPAHCRIASCRTAVLAGVVGLLLAGCSTPPVPAFDLSAPNEPVQRRTLVPGQLLVTEPVALAPYEEQRILVRDPSGAISFIGGAQWSDRLPRLVQTRLIQTFENASRLRAVSRPGDGTTAQGQLDLAIRAFQLDTATNEAFVEITAKLLNPGGQVTHARIFSARVPVPVAEGPILAQALDRAASTVFLDIVRWVGTGA